jgi:hypothetical protein
LAVANLAFVPATAGRIDAPVHEGGHTFALDHNNFGTGDNVPTNLMTAGGFRITPTPGNVPGSSPPTAQWVLQESPNATPSSALDLLTTGGSCTSINPMDPNYPNCTQQTAALLSGFLNATPPATALVCSTTFGCGGGGASVQTAAAASPTTTPTTPPPVPFEISGGFSDACQNSPICPNTFLAKVVIVLTKGKFNNNFKITGSSSSPMLAAPPIIFNGGNDENEEDDDAKGICSTLSPTASCLKLRFVRGAITGSSNNFQFLDFTIGTTPPDPNQLAGTVCYFWNRAPGVRYYSSCSDLGPNLFSDSQMVNLAINPLIPLNFPGTPGHSPCTIVPPATSCTDPTKSYTGE